ncbi:MAG: LamG domain-containing protein [bacterium]|nr:LamG domain-containing protein [bacterium]
MRYLLRSSFILALVHAAPANAQTVLHYWDFESTTDVVGGVPTSAVGVPDLSLHPTYGEAYSGSSQSLNSISGGTSAGGGFLEADVFAGGVPVALDFGTSNFAISYWSYNPNDGDARGPRIFDCLPGTSTGFQLGTNTSGNWNMRMDDDQGVAVTTSSAGLMQATDRWTHVSINVDRGNGQLSIYFDGGLQAFVPLVDSGTPLTGMVFPEMDLEIGVINGGSSAGQSQDAGLDDLAFYDALLGGADILGLANGTLTPLSFADIGQSYCGPAVPNSSGLAAEIMGAGSATAANNNLFLTATQLPVGQFGYFIAGQTQGSFTPPGSQGVICLTGNIGRYHGVPDIISGPTGSLQVDLNAIPVNPPQPALAGETWNFQCWFRDNNPALTSNFTDGLSVTFQ